MRDRVNVLIKRGANGNEKKRIDFIIKRYAEVDKIPDLSERELAAVETALAQADNGDKVYTDAEITAAELKIMDADYINVLIESLAKDEILWSTDAQKELINIFASAKQYVIAGLNNPNETIRAKLIDVLAGTGDPQFHINILDALKDKHFTVRFCAVRAVTAIYKKDKTAFNGKALEYIQNMLGDDTPVVRVRAADSLAEIKDAGSVSYITRALDKETVSFCVGSMCRALRALKDKAAVPVLIKVLENTDDSTRYYAAQALGDIADKAAVEPLLKVLVQKDTRFSQRYIVWALGQIGDKRAVKPLMDAMSILTYNSSNVTAITVLGKLGDISVVPLMLTKLNDKDTFMRQAAGKALQELKWKPDTAEERVLYGIAQRDYWVFKDDEKIAIPHLIKILKNNGFTRYTGVAEEYYWAARTLSNINDLYLEKNDPELKPVTEAVDILLSQFLNDDMCGRWNAFLALRNFKGDTTAANAIKPYIDDKFISDIFELGASPWGWDYGNCKYAAARLGRTKDKRALIPLIAAAHNWRGDGEVRNDCLSAIKMIEGDETLTYNDYDRLLAREIKLIKPDQAYLIPCLFTLTRYKRITPDFIELIGNFGPAARGVLAKIEETAKTDPDEKVRKAAAEAIAKIK